MSAQQSHNAAAGNYCTPDNHFVPGRGAKLLNRGDVSVIFRCIKSGIKIFYHQYRQFNPAICSLLSCYYVLVNT